MPNNPADLPLYYYIINYFINKLLDIDMDLRIALLALYIRNQTRKVLLVLLSFELDS
jgi:hypothetical protein